MQESGLQPPPGPEVSACLGFMALQRVEVSEGCLWMSVAVASSSFRMHGPLSLSSVEGDTNKHRSRPYFTQGLSLIRGLLGGLEVQASSLISAQD